MEHEAQTLERALEGESGIFDEIMVEGAGCAACLAAGSPTGVSWFCTRPWNPYLAAA